MKPEKLFNTMFPKAALLVMFTLPQLGFAECDFRTGIVQQGSGYLYSVDCHKQVGKMDADLSDRAKQVDALSQSLKLKDDAIVIQDERAQRLRESLYKVEDKVDSMERLKENNKWLYFGLGIAFTSLAVWGAGNLR